MLEYSELGFNRAVSDSSYSCVISYISFTFFFVFTGLSNDFGLEPTNIKSSAFIFKFLFEISVFFISSSLQLISVIAFFVHHLWKLQTTMIVLPLQKAWQSDDSIINFNSLDEQVKSLSSNDLIESSQTYTYDLFHDDSPVKATDAANSIGSTQDTLTRISLPLSWRPVLSTLSPTTSHTTEPREAHSPFRDRISVFCNATNIALLIEALILIGSQVALKFSLCSSPRLWGLIVAIVCTESVIKKLICFSGNKLLIMFIFGTSLIFLVAWILSQHSADFEFIEAGIIAAGLLGSSAFIRRTYPVEMPAKFTPCLIIVCTQLIIGLAIMCVLVIWPWSQSILVHNLYFSTDLSVFLSVRYALGYTIAASFCQSIAIWYLNKALTLSSSFGENIMIFMPLSSLFFIILGRLTQIPIDWASFRDQVMLLIIIMGTFFYMKNQVKMKHDALSSLSQPLNASTWNFPMERFRTKAISCYPFLLVESP